MNTVSTTYPGESYTVAWRLDIEQIVLSRRYHKISLSNCKATTTRALAARTTMTTTTRWLRRRRRTTPRSSAYRYHQLFITGAILIANTCKWAPFFSGGGGVDHLMNGRHFEFLTDTSATMHLLTNWNCCWIKTVFVLKMKKICAQRQVTCWTGGLIVILQKTKDSLK